jgi:Ca2+-binding RTX toxin-like protein
MYGQGGDDILTVTGSGVGSDAELYGDGGGMYEGAQGGNDTLIGGDGNESLYGDARGYSFVSPGSITGGTDNLNGGAGDDQLWGGPNNDRFVFNVGSGNDVINDFNQGNSVVGSTVIEHDIINLIAYSIGGFDALKAVISDDSNGNAVIHLSANDSLTLVGVHTGALQASDFIV